MTTATKPPRETAEALRRKLDQHVEDNGAILADVMNTLTEEAIGNAMAPHSVVAAATSDGWPVDPRALDRITDGWQAWLNSPEGQGLVLQIASDPYTGAAQSAWIAYQGVARGEAGAMTAILPRTSQEGQRAALAAANNRLVGATQATWNKTRGIIDDGLRRNLTREDIMGHLRDAGLPRFNELRADTVARTEVMKAANEGLVDSQRALGSAGYACKEWVSTGDDRTRDWHLEADGQVVPLNSQFIVGGELLDQPGDGDADNSVNCRCTVVFVDCPDPVDKASTLDDDSSSGESEDRPVDKGTNKTDPLANYGKTQVGSTPGFSQHSNGVSFDARPGIGTDGGTATIRPILHEYDNRIPGQFKQVLTDSNVEIRVSPGRLSDIDHAYADKAKINAGSRHETRSWERVGGVFNGGDRSVNLAGQVLGERSMNQAVYTMRHEVGHAVDFSASVERMRGGDWLSGQRAFGELHLELETKAPKLDWYFTTRGHGASGAREAFADTFAGWTASPSGPDGLSSLRLQLESMGASPGVAREMAPKFAAYFEALADELAKRQARMRV